MSRPPQTPASYYGYKSSTSSSVFSAQSHSTYPTTPSLGAASVFSRVEVDECPTPAPTLGHATVTVTPHATPVQSIRTLSPTPSSYSNTYVPTLTGAAMTSLHTTRLSPHPYLGVADGPRLSWDIRKPPTARNAVITQGGHTVSAFSGIAHLPATTPPAFTLHIALHNMPQWSVVVQSPNGQPITCQQLLDAIHAQLRAPVSTAELNASWTAQQQVVIGESYRSNRAQAGAEMPREVCRVDVLGSASRWAGLYFNEKQARLQYNIPPRAMNDSTVRTLVLTLSLA